MLKKILFCLLIVLQILSFASDKERFVPGHILSVPYQFPAIKDGRTKYVFPISIRSAPDRRSYYFAQQFQFVSGHIGYIGVRPWMGKNQMLLAFSIFGKGTKNINKTLCRYGADGGKGVSCSKLMSYIPDKKYYLTVQKVKKSSTHWQGYISDQPDAKQVLIGEWEVPPDWGNLIEHQVGFIEYFASVRTCMDIPMTDVTFYPPINGYLKKPNIKFNAQCAKRGGEPPIQKELHPSAYHFVINKP